MTDVLMPRLSDSMEEGTILTWLVEDGGELSEGQELVEIETDKATMTYEAEATGALTVVVPAGQTVRVGEVIARIGVRNEAAAPRAGAKADTGREAVTSAEADTGGEAVTSAKADTGGEAATSAEADTAAEATPNPANGSAGHLTHARGGFDAQRVPATPMARRVAAEHGISLGTLTGSGPRGRITRDDVLRAAGVKAHVPAAPDPLTTAPPDAHAPDPLTTAPPDAQTAAAPGTAPAPAPAGDRQVEPTRLQALIARRMAEAKATIPHFQVETEVEMTAALAFREELKALAATRDALAPSVNDLIVKASALALRRFPRANGSYADGRFVLHGAVNVGIAVAAEDALVVPVLHGADALTLGEIAARSREFAAAVRDGTVTPPQLSGGTFTVSNLGMYGMTAITPVINPPQAAILGVGAIREALARDRTGAIVDRRLLTLRLSCDHRILYGADAARFLGAIRELLEHPAGLAL
ncbi:MAG TPA: dihydrolipoamide acetyltransferase family protein [Solirubrobacteraceae bacterium]|nr:dihydrolipoamide acetyltransferase family protein [Solirubrobacteraceae bacterium]